MRMSQIVLIWIFLLALPAHAQDDFREWAASQRQKYNQFRKEEDQQFHRFLQKEWKQFRVMSGKREDPAPKPDDIPQAPLPGQDKQTPTPSSSSPKEEQAKIRTPYPREPSEAVSPEQAPGSSVSAETEEGKQLIRVGMLGHKLTFRLRPAWGDLDLEGVGEQQVQRFWKQFAGLDSEPILQEIERHAQELALGDWGRLIMTHRLARAVIGRDSEKNTASLLAWGWLLKGGSAVRIARSQDNIVLLYRSRQKVFQEPYFDLQGKRYYVFGEANPSQVSTYQGSYTGTEDRLDLLQQGELSAKGPRKKRNLKFRFRNETYQVKVSLCLSRIRFLNTIPQLSLSAYFYSESGKEVKDRLIPQLREAVSGMGQRERVNFLLRFAQMAFKYQKDDSQFGRENYLYPVETLFYPASDCEDRSILFSELVRQLLGLDVAVLDYPGHVATAVDLPQVEEGYRVTIADRTLLVADPTYLNARVGMVMPDFSEESPEILPLWEPYSESG